MMTILFAIAILWGRKLLNPQVLLVLLIIFILSDIATKRYLYNISGYVALKFSIKYMPAFLFGIATTTLKLPEKINSLKPRVYQTIAVSSTILILLMALPITLPAKFIYENLIIYLWLLIIYATLQRHQNRFSGENKVLNSLDRHSMSIYIIHHILIWAALQYIPSVIQFMEQHYYIAQIILFTIVFSMSWGIASISSKNRFTNYLFTGKLNPHSKKMSGR